MPTLIQQAIGSIGATGLVPGTTYVLGFDPAGQGAAGDGAKALTPDEMKTAYAPPISVVRLSPTSSENFPVFYTPVALTVSKIIAVVAGSTPSVTYSMVHGTSIASWTEIKTGGSTVTNTTTGTAVTSFDSATIPAGSWIGFTTTATSGTVDSIAVVVVF